MTAPREDVPSAVLDIPPDLVAALGRGSAIPSRLVELFRNLMLKGVWKPGSPIVETAIAKAIGVSQPSVREALRQLEAEGLILRRHYRSCRVTELSLEEVDHIFRLRVEWEGLAAELAVGNRDRWEPDQLCTAAEKLREAARRCDTNAFYKYDLEFHRILWECSGNPFLVKALSQITVPLFAFWALSHLRTSEVDLEAQAAAHEAITHAVFSGDMEQARKTTRQVIQGFWRDGVRVTAQR